MRTLVTGGGRGVGAAIVRALAEAGHSVMFTYRSAAQEAEALVDEMRAAGRSVEAHPLDVADKEAVEAFAARLEAGEPVLGFVHNAGMPYDTLAALMDQKRAETLMQVNFWAFSRLSAVLTRGMMRAREGRIVAIGSVTAERASRGNAPYAASKAALAGFARTLAVETAARKVTVNVIAPGFVDTDMLAAYAAHRDKVEGQIPAARFAKPEEIASLVRFLFSPEAAYITGAVIPVDGGLSAAIAIHR